MFFGVQFWIMWKCLAILAVFLLIGEAAPPVPGQAADSSTGASSAIQRQASPHNEPTAKPSPSFNAARSPKHDAAGDGQAKDNAEHPVAVSKLPTVTIARDWGIWAFSGLLVVVGLLQVLLLFRTLRAIKRQGDHMERQTKLMEGQAAIQAAGMQQWVDVGTKGVGSPELLKTTSVAHLKFEAVNNTAFPVTIQRIVTKVSVRANEWDTFTVDARAILPPSGKGRSSNAYPFYIPMKLEDDAEAERFKRGTILTINGEVTFEDCLQKTCVQRFSGLYACGPGRFEYLEPLGIVPDQQKERDDQDPN